MRKVTLTGASQVRVIACQSDGQMRVEIEDNGRGVELNAKGMPGRNAGLGILGMRERAARVGGVLTLESSPGRGLRIGLRIPLMDLSIADGKPAAAESGVGA